MPVEQLTAGANPLGLTHAIGNVAEWCKDSDNRNGYVLRGCSIVTANLNDVRVTWRARGDANGEESSGFRVIVPVTGFILEPVAKPVATAREVQPGGGGVISTPVRVLLTMPWGELAKGLRSEAGVSR